MPESKFLIRSEIDPEKWDAFVAGCMQPSIFAKAWYLDAVAPEWSAVVVEGEGRWEAAMPLNLRRKGGVLYSLAPRFTQHTGPMLAPELNQKNRVFHREKQLLNALIAGIPPGFKLFDHKFHPTLQYLLPFYWSGFEISPRYSFFIDLKPGWEAIQSRLTDSLKSDLKLAAREGLTIRETETPDGLIQLLQAGNLAGDGDELTLRRLWKTIFGRSAGMLLEAHDVSGKVLCAIMVLMEDGKAIYLLGASEPGPGKGANTLLLNHAIQLCCKSNISVFDFEGSMIEPVENYFRAFNPEMKIYYRVRRDRLPWWVKAVKGMKDFVTRM